MVLIYTHYTQIPGVMEKMAGYLKRRDFELCYILNPLFPASELKSKIQFGNKQIEFKLSKYTQFLLEGIISFIKYKKIIKNKNIDFALCFDPLSFFHVFLLKRFFRIKKIIYYNVDYSSVRYKNNTLNFFYVLLNKFAYRKSDAFFTLSKRFIEEIDPKKKYLYKTYLLTHTVELIKNDSHKNNSQKLKIVYAGSLSYTVDFSNFIEATSKMKENGVDFIVDIYGDGDRKFLLEELINKNNLKDTINFKGVVSNDILTKDILPRYDVGICPYIKQKNNSNNFVANHMFNGENLTTKLVEYIAAGLIIITTRLFPFFSEIEKENFGYIVDTTKEWENVMTSLYKNKDLRTRYSLNASKYAKKYDEDVVLTPIFDKILKDNEKD